MKKNPSVFAFALFFLIVISGQTIQAQGLLGKLKDGLQDLGNKVDNVVEDIRNKDYENAINDIRDVSDTYKHHKNEIKSELTYSAVTMLKNVPVKDPDSGQIITFDQYARILVYRYGGNAVYGSELEQDPVALAVKIMMDDTYYINARIFRDQNGQWMSLQDYSRRYLGVTLR